ncbi:glycosyltransferase family 4 protein [bacterium]|nr:glycosyltransferase family 4 protein [bacterium]
MIVITDLLTEPYDEGAKCATLNLIDNLKQHYGSIIFSINGDDVIDYVDFSYSLNKLLFNLSFYKKVKSYNDKVLYIPEASITTGSFIRAGLIKTFTKSRVTMLSMQPRKYNPVEKLLIKITPKIRVITQSSSGANYLNRMGISTLILPLGVDDNKFNVVDGKSRILLRKMHSIPFDANVILHVGHIRESRNLEWLIKIKQCLPEIKVIIVGSTSTVKDERLYKSLVQNGIITITDYVQNIEEIYKIADYYIFPVINKDAAIETPLSVFEAMACNIPIITTRFGCLPDIFRQDQWFHYVKTSDEVVKILQTHRIGECNNRNKIKLYTWSSIAKQISEIIG